MFNNIQFKSSQDKKLNELAIYPDITFLINPNSISQYSYKEVIEPFFNYKLALSSRGPYLGFKAEIGKDESNSKSIIIKIIPYNRHYKFFFPRTLKNLKIDIRDQGITKSMYNISIESSKSIIINNSTYWKLTEYCGKDIIKPNLEIYSALEKIARNKLKRIELKPTSYISTTLNGVADANLNSLSHMILNHGALLGMPIDKETFNKLFKDTLRIEEIRLKMASNQLFSDEYAEDFRKNTKEVIEIIEHYLQILNRPSVKLHQARVH